MVQTKVGTTKFTAVYSQIRQGSLTARRERKAALAIMVCPASTSVRHVLTCLFRERPTLRLLRSDKFNEMRQREKAAKGNPTHSSRYRMGCVEPLLIMILVMPTESERRAK
jgi:U3 small nucleolar RNA-associated protein 20